MKSVILSLHQDIINGRKKVLDITNTSIKLIKDVTWSGSVVTECFDRAIKHAKLLDEEDNKENLLFGIPYALKENFCTKNITTTGGSQFLHDYLPPFDSKVFEILEKNQTVMLCKTSMDEFGMGGTGLNTLLSETSNVRHKGRIAGGSSSGSVNLVACGAVPFALGTDTGDSSRRPATFVGVVGYKPTYGLISRYGVLPYAPSLDHVGIITRTVEDVAIVLTELNQFDSKDYTSQNQPKIDFYQNLKEIKSLKIGIVKSVEKYLDQNVLSAYLKVITLLKDSGHQIIEVDFNEDELKSIHPVYYAISFVESSSCWSNLTGINFSSTHGGRNFDEIIKINRTKMIHNEAKRRFTIGAHISSKENFDKYFVRSQKIRRYLANKWEKCFNDVDTILTVGASSIAPTIEEIKSHKATLLYADDLLILANLAGTPSISIPGPKVDAHSWGINLNCKQFEDQQLLNIANSIETLFEKKGVYDE